MVRIVTTGKQNKIKKHYDEESLLLLLCSYIRLQGM